MTSKAEMNVLEPPSRATSGLFFPEIPEEDPGETCCQRLSPLHEIIHELRRKSSVTAAASSGSQPISFFDNLRSDPWGSSEEVLGAFVDDESVSGLSFNTICTCHGFNRRSVASHGRRKHSWDARYTQTRNFLGYSSPFRIGNGNLLGNGEGQPQSDDGFGECPDCGKPYVSVSMVRTNVESLSGSPISPRRMRMNYWLDTSRVERLEAPRHAEALLRVTPQLRIISPASTDMDVLVTSNPNNIFNFFSTSVNRNSNSPRIHTNIVSTRTSAIHGNSSVISDYRTSLKRERVNQQAAEELASLLWTCAHEMSLEEFGIVESETFTNVFGLVHSLDSMDRRMAGIAALDALVEVPSADEEKKAIKFANTLSGGLRSAHGNYEFLSAISKAIGHMARKNVDFVESEITRALEWLRTDRSERRYERSRLASLMVEDVTSSKPLTFLFQTCRHADVKRICYSLPDSILFEDEPVVVGARRIQ
jgi:hypothetical protein